MSICKHKQGVDIHLQWLLAHRWAIVGLLKKVNQQGRWDGWERVDMVAMGEGRADPLQETDVFGGCDGCQILAPFPDLAMQHRSHAVDSCQQFRSRRFK